MSIRKPLILMALAAALLAPAGAALADNGHGHGRGHDKHRYYEDDDDRVVIIRPAPRRDPYAYHRGYDRGFDDGVRFADRDRYRMRDWYTRYPSYYRPLPPGHYKKLVRGGYLPPGYYALPPGLARDFEPLPRGYGYYVVDRDVVIASVATGLILDVLLGGN